MRKTERKVPWQGKEIITVLNYQSEPLSVAMTETKYKINNFIHFSQRRKVRANCNTAYTY